MMGAHLSEIKKEPIRYLICSSGRSGSTLLFDLLQSTGVAGKTYDKGGEELNPRKMDARNIDWDKKDLRDFIKEIFDSGRTSNGVSGFKILWHHLEHFTCKLNKTKTYKGISVWSIKTYFPSDTKYIYLVRKDKVRQAVSFVKANQTKVWRSWDLNSVQSCKVLNFDPVKIFHAVASFKKHERAWERFFKINGIAPLRIEYEEFIKDFRGTVVRILEYLGIPVPENLEIKTDLLKQSDTLSEEWVQQYYKTIIPELVFFCVRRCANGIMRVIYRASACLKEHSPWYAQLIKKLKGEP